MAHTCYKELGLRYHDLYWTETLIDAAERRPWVRFSLSQMAFSICVQTPRCCLDQHSQYFHLTLDLVFGRHCFRFFFRQTGKGRAFSCSIAPKRVFLLRRYTCTYERCHPEAPCFGLKAAFHYPEYRLCHCFISKTTCRNVCSNGF